MSDVSVAPLYPLELSRRHSKVLAWIDTRLHELRASDRAVAKAAADHPLGADELLQAATADVGVDVARVEYLGSTHLLECAARFAERRSK